MLYLVQEAGEEGVGHVVVEKRSLIHQNAFDVLTEGRIFTQQLHTRLSQNRLKRDITAVLLSALNRLLYYILSSDNIMFSLQQGLCK